MHNFQIRSFIGGLIYALALAWGTSANAQAPVDGVRNALQQLHSWVGTEQNGQNWRTFLQSNELESQLALGTGADFGAVTKIRNLYASSTPGLDLGPFVTVRAALDQWLAAMAINNPEQFAKLANASKEMFVEIPPDVVPKAKQELVSALAALDNFLVSTSGQANAAAWHKYLQTEIHRAQLANDKPDIAELSDVLTRYAGNKKGQELQQFMNVRSALRNYIGALSLAQDPNPKQTYAQKLDELVKRVDEYAKHPTSDEAVAIGQIIGWLQRAGQAAPLVAVVENRFWKPNLYASVSPRLINAGVDNIVADTTPVQENIIGTAIYGTAQTNGYVSLVPVPDPNRAALELRLTGTTATQTVGYNGPVTIYSHSCSQLFATKRLWFDMNGLTSSPATSHVISNSTIDDICARLRLIERIAWKKAGESKGQADVIANGIAKQKLATRVDTQAVDMLSQANGDFYENVIYRAQRRDVYPRLAQLSTTSDQLNVQVMHVTQQQLAAPTAPPTAPTGYDLAVRYHESAVGNYSESIVGGVRLTDVRIAELVKDATGSVPKDLEITDETDPWALTFATSRPVSVKLENDELAIRIHIQKLERGDNDGGRSVKNIRLVAIYTMQGLPAAPKLVRKGDLDVEFLDNKVPSLNAAQIGVKAFLRLKFGPLLKPEIPLDAIKLKGRMAKVGSLMVQTFTTKDGWGTITFNTVATPSAPANMVEIVPETTPALLTSLQESQ